MVETMKKTGFAFLASFLLALACFTGAEQIPLWVQAAGALVLIALFGIPHGAIDHILFTEAQKVGKFTFYTSYIGAMALFTLAWWVWPVFSFVFFLALSAYHFGQSQFSDVKNDSTTVLNLLNLSWGCSILSGLLVYNGAELSGWLQSAPDLAYLQVILKTTIQNTTLFVSTLATMALLAYLALKMQLDTNRLLMELYFLALIHLCFYLLPLLVGFTLYFTTLHAVRVLSEEFGYLKTRRHNFSLKQFIALLLPYTMLSVLGAGVLFFLSLQGFLEISDFLLGLILVSALTLPHSVVMHGFYQKIKREDRIPA